MGAEPRFKGRRNQWPVWCVYLVSPVASLQLASTKHASITAAGGKEPKFFISPNHLRSTPASLLLRPEE
jgi:hypothetical protein